MRRLWCASAYLRSDALRLIHALSRRAPASFHDVADFPHSAHISVADALLVGAAVAIRVEATRRVPEQLLLPGCGRGECPPILARHVAIERLEAAVRAN